MQQPFDINEFPSVRTSSNFPQNNTSRKAIIRLFHAAPDLNELAVYVNGHQVTDQMPYGRLTAYMEWEEGVYDIEVIRLTTKERVLFSRMVLKENETYTLCMTGARTGFALLTEPHYRVINLNERAALTFVQLSPDLPPIDVYEREQNILSKDLGYVNSSQIHYFTPSKYHFELKASGTQSVLLDIPKVNLQQNRAYIIFLHGFANGEPELMAKVALSGQI
ncbi:DUF4397 domain-containing protein [Bacillus sp. 179-C3.3 HS]|uniref:DUF4397 domain-containing protein n=1 Tax=Bacillus sp. 179-C3.3 HS TaxID=3232162 RepID=UPI00399FE482